MSERDALSTMVGRMRVGDLARQLGLSVDELVEAVLSASRTRSPRRRPAVARPRVEEPPVPAPPVPSPPAPSPAKPKASARTRSRARAPKTAPAGREPTRVELHAAVDRWILGEVLEEEGGNISHVAERLGINRKRVRERWAKVRRLQPDEMSRRFALVRGASKPPSPRALRAHGSLNAIHEAVDRWMVGHVLGQEGGNVTLAAQRLGTSRRLIRELRSRLLRD